MNKLSKKRAAQNRTYLKQRDKFLTENPICQAGLDGCQHFANQIHHQKGRIGYRLTDVSNFLSVCGSCHSRIENEPVLSKEKNLSKSRLYG